MFADFTRHLSFEFASCFSWDTTRFVQDLVLSLGGRKLLEDGRVIGFYIPEPSCML